MDVKLKELGHKRGDVRHNSDGSANLHTFCRECARLVLVGLTEAEVRRQNHLASLVSQS